MERLDQELAAAIADATPASAPARVLLVGCHADIDGALTGWLRSRDDMSCHVHTFADATRAIDEQIWDVMLLDPSLPDGDGLELISRHQKRVAYGRTLVLSAELTAENVVKAMRLGASDYVKLPVATTDLLPQVEQILVKALVGRHRDERMLRLKKICTELNDARHEVSKQVDTLCNDLVNAYQELSDQMGEVALATEFRTLMRQELDVEELLRTMLEYLLTKTGPTNAAVFLPDAEGQYSLGAYVNYDCPRDSVAVLLDHLSEVICPSLAVETGIVSFNEVDDFSAWAGEDADFLADSNVIAYGCHHEGDCMAVVVLYRDASTPYDADTPTMIDTMRMIFAEQLGRIIRIHHRATPQWPAEASDDTYGFGDYDDDFDTDDLDLAA